MNAHSTKLDPAPGPGGSTKFTYPSGSRPLEGYTIKRGVGHGGFGEVYFATSDAGKEVALKLIRRNLEIELRGVRHCLNLKHPDLVGLFDIRTDERGDSWVVMEYVAGESLEDAIDRNPNGMPVDEVLRWMGGIAAGVTYLHDRGIVHRDLKPGNIFIDEGLVKIGDYGLSKFISCSRRSGQTESVGTVHYMAPEIANGRYGKEIDVYALGIMLYEMLTGHVPFEGESVGEILMKHLTAEPKLDGLAEPYRTAVARALTKDPEVRVRTVPELMALLPAVPQSATHPLPPAASAPVVEAVVVHDEPSSNSAGGAQTPEAAVGGTAGPSGYDHQSSGQSARLPDEEPIWAGIRAGWANVQRGWRQWNISEGWRTAILVLLVLGLVMTAQVWIPLGVTLVIVYGIYWLIRAVVIAAVGPPPTRSDPSPSSPPVRGGNGEPPPTIYKPGRRLRRPRSEDIALTAFLGRSRRQRVTELTGSLTLSAFVVATVALVMAVIATQATGESIRPELYGWMALTSLLGAWGVMLPAKLWEGRRGEPLLRRFVMLLVGLGVGLAAWGFDQGLMAAPLHYRSLAPLPGIAGAMSPNIANPDGSPTLLAYLVYFGCMFLTLRWWLQADPLRPTRLSLWTTALVMLVAWILYLIWQFPQPWGAMIAVTTAVAVQLSSPWFARSPHRRYHHLA